MKRFFTLAVSFIFAAVLAVSAFAQTGATQPGAGKIGWIITGAFGDSKDGITKYVNTEKALETEMKPRLLELQNLQARMKTLSDDLAKINANTAIPVDQKVVAAKTEEGQRLQREFEFKQKDAQAAYAKRQDELLGPILTTVYSALQDYAKLKGYAVVIDISTLGQADQPSPIIVLDPSANITKDFITWFNAKPATTATTATPKP